MAIVTGYGTGYKNPASLSAINTRNRGAEMRSIVSVVTPAAGDSATSRYFVGTIPSTAIIDPSSSIVTGVTGFTAADLGFTNSGGGALLGTGLNLNAAAVLPLPLLQAAANVGKAAWQMAGLAADPGGELDVILTPTAGTGLVAPAVVILKYFNQ